MLWREVINITKKALNQKSFTPTIRRRVVINLYPVWLIFTGMINKRGHRHQCIHNVDYGGFGFAPTDVTGNGGFKNDGFRQRSVQPAEFKTRKTDKLDLKR